MVVLALSPMFGIACSSSSGGGGPASGGSGNGGSGNGGSVTSGSGGSGSGGLTSSASGGSDSGGATVQTTGGSGTGGQTASATGGSNSGGQTAPATGGAGGQTTSGNGGHAGAGTGGAGTNGDAGVMMTDASGTKSDAAGSQTFVCSQVLGLMLTDQWYTAGFEKAPGIDDARWQLKWMDHAYIDEWANPNSTFWGIAPTSPCATSSNSPDRVVLVALSWTILTLADWQTNVQKDVDNIKAKYPSVKQIVLMTIIRGPGNKSCGNTTVVAENTLIPSYVDQALANVAAASPDLVKVAPKFEAAACSDFMGTGPHLTAAGDMAIAQMVAAAFANQ